MKNNRNKKNLIAMLVIIVIALITWAGFSLYFNLSKDHTEIETDAYTKSINKSFDLETIQDVVNRLDESFSIKPETFRDYEDTQNTN